MTFPERKLPRKTDFCYSARETYFLTICAKDKQEIFSKIIPGEGFDPPIVELSPIGRIVEKNILTIPNIKGVIVEKYVIMPDHIHLLVFINSNIDDNAHHKSTPTDIVPRIIASLKRFVNKEVGYNVFQNSYFDHIIRSNEDYDRHWNYIEHNPLSWLYKKGIIRD